MLNILQKNVEITELSNFKTKCYTSYYYELTEISQIDELSKIYWYADNNKLEVLFIWGWTNILFAFEKFNWIVIKNSLKGYEFDDDTKLLKAFSAEPISDIALSLEVSWNTNLWHRFIWLPWSIWGAVYWNAGCFGLETENNFVSWLFFDKVDKKIAELDNEQLNFSYRNSILKETKRYICVSATFDLSKKVEKYHSDIDNIDFRENKQPKGNSCWSFFRNPSWDSAWKLIEQVWLKWYELWTAYISNLHANFIMSKDNWNYKDLLSIIDMVTNKVKWEYWIVLEPEVQIIKNN